MAEREVRARRRYLQVPVEPGATAAGEGAEVREDLTRMVARDGKPTRTPNVRPFAFVLIVVAAISALGFRQC